MTDDRHPAPDLSPEWQALADQAAAATVSAARHRYLSTACHHGQHTYCQATTREDGSAKRPASCKFCAAPCTCPCHREGNPAPAVQDPPRRPAWWWTR